jgi:hypothetical protein
MNIHTSISCVNQTGNLTGLGGFLLDMTYRTANPISSTTWCIVSPVGYRGLFHIPHCIPVHWWMCARMQSELYGCLMLTLLRRIDLAVIGREDVLLCHELNDKDSFSQLYFVIKMIDAFIICKVFQSFHMHNNTAFLFYWWQLLITVIGCNMYRFIKVCII